MCKYAQLCDFCGFFDCCENEAAANEYVVSGLPRSCFQLAALDEVCKRLLEGVENV